MLLTKGLNQEEITNAQPYISNFGTKDLQNINNVLKSVDKVAINYFSSPHPHEMAPWMLAREDSNKNTTIGEYFFTTYLIGGQITKSQPRKDIDLMIVTNMYYGEDAGFTHDEDEWIYQSLREHCENNLEIKLLGNIPDRYNLGVTKGKAIFTGSPKEKEASPLDIVYVRSFYQQKDTHFISEEDFNRLDVNNQGNQLLKIPIYRYTEHSSGSTISTILETKKMQQDLTKIIEKNYQSRKTK